MPSLKSFFMFLELSHTKKPVFQESKRFVPECYKVTKDFPTRKGLQWFNKSEGPHYLFILTLPKDVQESRKVGESDSLKYQGFCYRN